ncbi:HD domain-containing protein [Geothrix sp. 21YS21S-2]|uniref:HD domain-containing protein n=1 Tax=Geothrix sp. 21YS21S-2 TaxID=3068893 RepID=UPI0027BB002C|nr:HD domain-containing protein [Geothrix sp. 21YS21S-2]
MAFPLGPRFQEALAFAAQVHTGQYRKGTAIPYVSHVLAATATVLEHGADEEVAIACLLHDAVEDGGGLPVLEEIRTRFGPRVADLVLECTDATVTPKPPWRARKEAYLAHLAVASAGARLIVLGDKLHNASSLVRDLRAAGSALWDRFNAGPGETAWYYRSVVEILGEKGRTPLLDQLDAVVGELEKAILGA